MSNPGKQLVTVNFRADQIQRIKGRVHELGTNMSAYLRDLVTKDMLRQHEPSDEDFVTIEPEHEIRYEELTNVAIMLNSMNNKRCTCQFCAQPMEMVDMRRRFDRFEGRDVYENVEVFYECGNGECSSGTRTMIEVGA